MRKIVMFVLIATTVLCSSVSLPARSSAPESFTVTVKITNIRNSHGKIQLQIYRDQNNFAKENPWKVYYVSKKEMKGNTITYQIPNLPSGKYGLALLDDENNNTKMDYGLVMPKEGFGFSDYYHTSWSRPSFDDFDFSLHGDKTVRMVIRYV